MTEPPSGSPWDPEHGTPRRPGTAHGPGPRSAPAGPRGSVPGAPPDGPAPRDPYDHSPTDPHGPYGAHGPSAAPGGREPEPPFQGPLTLLSRAAWQAVLVTGVCSLVLGVLVLVWPGASLFAAGVLFGLYLLLSGVLQLASAFGTHRTTSLRVLAFVSGALSILLGLFCFRGPLQSILLLGLWIGIGWLFRGIAQALAAAHDPAMPARGWQLFLGLLTAVAGVVLVVAPVESVAVLTVVAGCWLLAVGAVEIVTALRIRARRAPSGRISQPAG
ncbi:DUF308 domain-containing protein [Streptomyces sp. NPDC085946]|uniref:HdeD family acid-resistance protein n=1 Tax=Streptomyces sp. NPDC085946 TaxID=3365744 RepID=UPI0037D66C65